MVEVGLVRVTVLHFRVLVLVGVPGIRGATFVRVMVMPIVVPMGMGMP